MFSVNGRKMGILVIILMGIQGVPVIYRGLPSGISKQETINSRSYDLQFSYTMNKHELTYNRLIVLSRQWDKLFLNLSVQNYGESIDTILTSIKINNILTDHSFSSNERDGLKNCLVYQFDQPQTLIIPLNYTYQEILSVSISLYLDALISWREVEYNFVIFSAFLNCINLVQPLNEQPLMIMSRNFHYTLQSSQISYFGRRLLVRSYIPVKIPDNLFLSSILEMTITGGKFDYVSLRTGNRNDYAFEGNLVRINTTVDINDLKDQIWYIEIHIIPMIDSYDDYTLITFSLRASGILKEKLLLDKDLDLINHPIPGIIMIPVLIFFLFGIPYYYVYQEELTEKDDQIIESELGRI